MSMISDAVAAILGRLAEIEGGPRELPWLIYQEWRSLLFASWPVAPEAMRAKVPEPLAIDTFDGKAWLTAVPMYMADLHVRDLPSVPGIDRFPEVNLRTYVRSGDVRGVYFFSIDCSDAVADFFASRFLAMPYLRARMSYSEDGGGVTIASERRGAAPPARFEARYGPIGDPFALAEGTLEHFLLERYTALSPSASGRVVRCDVAHSAWAVQRARAELADTSLVATAGLPLLEAQPTLLYAAGSDVVAWLPTEIER